MYLFFLSFPFFQLKNGVYLSFVLLYLNAAVHL